MGVRIEVRQRIQGSEGVLDPKAVADAGASYRFCHGRVLFGRGPGSDVLLPHGAVSQCHASLRETARGYEVFDEGSTHGTWARGMRLIPERGVVMGPAITLQIGPFEVHCEQDSLLSRSTSAQHTVSLAKKLLVGLIEEPAEALEARLELLSKQPHRASRSSVGKKNQRGPGTSQENAPAAYAGRGTSEQAGTPQAAASRRGTASTTLVVEASFPLPRGRALSLGRDPSCDIVLSEPSFSRNHFTLEPSEQGVQFRDAGGKNPSRVNGQLVHHAWLRDGDMIEAGGRLFRFADPIAERLCDLGRAKEDAAMPAVAMIGEQEVPAGQSPAAGQNPGVKSIASGTASESRLSGEEHHATPEQLAFRRGHPTYRALFRAVAKPEVLTYVLAALVLAASIFGLYWIFSQGSAG